MTFSAGDVVQVKSGGPIMTVDEYEAGLVVCVWFEGTKKKSDAFGEATLTKAATATRRAIRFG